jgi:hypothetical protein
MVALVGFTGEALSLDKALRTVQPKKDSAGPSADGGIGVPLGAGSSADGTADASVCDATEDPSDESCVIDDAYGVFVAAPANDAGDPDASTSAADGSMAHPYPTIGQALSRLGSKTRVYVCNGLYGEQVTVTSPASTEVGEDLLLTDPRGAGRDAVHVLRCAKRRSFRTRVQPQDASADEHELPRILAERVEHDPDGGAVLLSPHKHAASSALATSRSRAPPIRKLSMMASNRCSFGSRFAAFGASG